MGNEVVHTVPPIVSLAELVDYISVNSGRQLKVTPMTAGGIEPEMDAITSTRIGISFSHHEIHEKNAYVSPDLQNVSTTTIKWQITTPNTPKLAHIIWHVECTGEMTILVTAGADRTDGTSVAICNRYQDETPEVSGLTVSRAPTGGSTDGTTVLMNRRSGATGPGAQADAPSSARGASEFVLKRNTKHIVSVTTYADVWVTFDPDWYEHTSDQT